MQKLNIILLILILSSGCSVFKTGRSKNASILSESGNVALKQNLKERNITNKGFYIQKADIEIRSEGTDQKLVGSIKFELPDKFLISLRSKTGIEVARIFITDDTILINDRINRTLYHGKPDFLARKYGFNTSVLPLIFGDFVSENNVMEEPDKCVAGKMNVTGSKKGIRILYTINCRNGKPVAATEENSYDNTGIEFRYDDFIRRDSLVTPGKIYMKYLKMNTEVDMRIMKVEFPWNGNVEFIPGNKYELMELL